MLRISRDPEDAPSATLRLEGRVTGPWVVELRRVCTEALANNARGENHLVIDLAGVSFLDAAGVTLLRELTEQDVLFTNGSAFIAEQLKGVVDVNG